MSGTCPPAAMGAARAPHGPRAPGGGTAGSAGAGWRLLCQEKTDFLPGGAEAPAQNASRACPAVPKREQSGSALKSLPRRSSAYVQINPLRTRQCSILCYNCNLTASHVPWNALRFSRFSAWAQKNLESFTSVKVVEPCQPVGLGSIGQRGLLSFQVIFFFNYGSIHCSISCFSLDNSLESVQIS